jgi:hypothetical protein
LCGNICGFLGAIPKLLMLNLSYPPFDKGPQLLLHHEETQVRIHHWGVGANARHKKGTEKFLL